MNEKADGPIVYADLAELALSEPSAKVYAFVERDLQERTGKLAELLVEQLRQAYIAGVADGYRDAVIRGKVPETVERG